MEIKQALAYPMTTATLIARREAAVVSGKKQSDHQGARVSGTAVESLVKAGDYHAEAFESAVRQLEERRVAAEDKQPQHVSMTLSTRARQAVSAYETQQNLPQEEAQSAVREILGVDYFA